MKQAIKYLTEKDAIFKEIIDKYGIPEIPKRPEGFETLVLLILEQQVSIASAKASFIKLKSICSPFTPNTLFTIKDDEYRAIGISRQKQAT